MKLKKIVIADDDPDLVEALRKRCEALNLYVVTAYDAFDALSSIHESEPGLICLDVNMPSGNGLSVLEMLANDEDLSGIPVIIMSGDSNEETVRRCHDHGAYYVEKCSDLWPRLEPLICELLCVTLPAAETTANGPSGFTSAASCVENAVKPTIPQTTSNRKGDEIVTVETENTTESRASSAATPAKDSNRLVDLLFEMLDIDEKFFEIRGANRKDNNEPPWVLCIDDDAEYSHALRLRLERHGVAVVRAFEGMDGYRSAFKRPADLILLDYEMPNGKGDYILGRLKDNPVTQDIPVVVITGRKDRALERKMINLGAAKFMNKPPDFDELLCELRKHIDILPLPVGI